MPKQLARLSQRHGKKHLSKKEETLLQTKAAFYLSLGYSAKALSGKLNIKYGKALRLKDDPKVLERKAKYSQDFQAAAQEKFEYLFHDSVNRLQSIVNHAEPEEALKAIKLIFDAQGRIPTGGRQGGSMEEQFAQMMAQGGGMVGGFAIPSEKVNTAMELLSKSRQESDSPND